MGCLCFPTIDVSPHRSYKHTKAGAKTIEKKSFTTTQNTTISPTQCFEHHFCQV